LIAVSVFFKTPRCIFNTQVIFVAVRILEDFTFYFIFYVIHRKYNYFIFVFYKTHFALHALLIAVSVFFKTPRCIFNTQVIFVAVRILEDFTFYFIFYVIHRKYNYFIFVFYKTHFALHALLIAVSVFFKTPRCIFNTQSYFCCCTHLIYIYIYIYILQDTFCFTCIIDCCKCLY